MANCPMFFSLFLFVFHLLFVSDLHLFYNVLWQTAEMADVEQLEELAAVDAPQVLAADNDNDNGNDNENGNGNGVNDVDVAAVHIDDDIDDDDDDDGDVDDDDVIVDVGLTGSATAPVKDN